MVKQVRAVRTRQTLVVAAAETFADVGYALATLPVISRRAASAQGFALPLREQGHPGRGGGGRGGGGGARAGRPLSLRGRHVLQALVDITCRLLLLVAADPVVRAGFRLNGDPSRKSRAGLLRWWRTLVRDLIEQAERAGELAPDVSAEAAVVAVVTATFGFQAVGAADRSWLATERLAQFWNFTLPRLASSPDHGMVSAALAGGPGGRHT